MQKLKVTLGTLMADISLWKTVTQIRKDPSRAFDIRTYWKQHIYPNTEAFNEEHKQLLLDVGGTQQPDGTVKKPEDLSDAKEDKLNEGFEALRDKEITIPRLNMTLRDFVRACKDPISEAVIDNMDKYCRPETSPKRGKSRGKNKRR